MDNVEARPVLLFSGNNRILNVAEKYHRQALLLEALRKKPQATEELAKRYGLTWIHCGQVLSERKR